jgi:hypothetical protein
VVGDALLAVAVAGENILSFVPEAIACENPRFPLGFFRSPKAKPAIRGYMLAPPAFLGGDS